MTSELFNLNTRVCTIAEKGVGHRCAIAAAAQESILVWTEAMPGALIALRLFGIFGSLLYMCNMCSIISGFERKLHRNLHRTVRQETDCSAVFSPTTPSPFVRGSAEEGTSRAK